jgi:uncharacterized protein
MNFEHRITIPVPRQQLWRFLMDVPQMASCIPGAQNVIAEDDNRYKGSLRVKLGPINLNLQGVATIFERDEQQWRAVARAEANDRRIGGGAHVTANMSLIENGYGATELVVQAQARFLGKLGEFGEPLIRKQANATVAAFASNVAAHFQPPAAAQPAGELARSAIPTDSRQPGPSTQPAIAWPLASLHLIGIAVGFVIGILIVMAAPLPAKTLLRCLLIAVMIGGLMALGGLIDRSLRGRRT